MLDVLRPDAVVVDDRVSEADTLVDHVRCRAPLDAVPVLALGGRETRMDVFDARLRAPLTADDAERALVQLAASGHGR